MGVPSTSARTASRNALPEGTEGCARWVQPADGRASSPGPRRSAAACSGRVLHGVTVVGAELLATGLGKAVRTAAGPARADLGCTGCAAPHSGRGPRVRPKERMLVADWGSAGTMRHAGRTVAQAVRRHILPRKNVWDGGGSHRRSRAASTAALWYVATNTPLTPAPARVRSSQGEEQLPHALWRPCSGSSNTPNSCLVREVCWVLPLGSAVFFVGSYTEVEPAQASGSPTLAWGAGRTDGGRPSHEEHARRQTRRIPGPHPH